MPWEEIRGVDYKITKIKEKQSKRALEIAYQRRQHEEAEQMNYVTVQIGRTSCSSAVGDDGPAEEDA